MSSFQGVRIEYTEVSSFQEVVYRDILISGGWFHCIHLIEVGIYSFQEVGIERFHCVLISRVRGILLYIGETWHRE